MDKNKRKEWVIYLLINIWLGLFVIYFGVQYNFIITYLISGYINLQLTKDYFYVLNTIVLSIVLLLGFITIVRRIYIIDISTGEDVTDCVEIQVYTDKKKDKLEEIKFYCSNCGKELRDLPDFGSINIIEGTHFCNECVINQNQNEERLTDG